MTDPEENDLLNRLKRGEEVVVKLRKGPQEFCRNVAQAMRPAAFEHPELKSIPRVRQKKVGLQNTVNPRFKSNQARAN
jgi:hypothetical protein